MWKRQEILMWSLLFPGKSADRAGWGEGMWRGERVYSCQSGLGRELADQEHEGPFEVGGRELQ